MIRIGCIEADADLREMLGMILGEAGFEVVAWPMATGAQAFLRRERPDVLLLEMRFDGDYAGLRLLRDLRDDPATAAIAAIACTGDTRFLRTHDRDVRALNCAVLEKPFTADQLLGAIRRALDPPRFSLRNRKAARCQCAML